MDQTVYKPSSSQLRHNQSEMRYRYEDSFSNIFNEESFGPGQKDAGAKT